jgi:RNA polymerase sigma-70 factor (ECF subfamily)
VERTAEASGAFHAPYTYCDLALAEIPLHFRVFPLTWGRLLNQSNPLAGRDIHTTPATLLERLRGAHNGAAWDWFVDLYTPLLFSWARRCGETEADAADLVQEVFVTLVQTLPTFDYDRAGTFRGWLRVLLLNKLRDRLRRKVRLEKALEHRPADVELPDIAEVFWEAEYHQELARQALRLMQAEFAPTTWKACWETVVAGRSRREVARDLGISENAVYIAKCRVLRRLRQELTGLFE